MSYNALLKSIEEATRFDDFESLENSIEAYLTKLKEEGILDSNGRVILGVK